MQRSDTGRSQDITHAETLTAAQVFWRPLIQEAPPGVDACASTRQEERVPKKNFFEQGENAALGGGRKIPFVFASVTYLQQKRGWCPLTRYRALV